MRKGDGGGVAAIVPPLSSFSAGLLQAAKRLLGKIKINRKIHSLRLQETLVFGDRRFLAVVEWQDKKLLVGVTPQSITLLDSNEEKSVYESRKVPEQER